MAEILKTWQRAQGFLKEKLGETVFETWILPLKPNAKSSNELTLEAPDMFFRDWVEKHYKTLIAEAVNLTGQGITVSLEAAAQSKTVPDISPPQILQTKTQDSPGTANLNSRYTF